LVRSIFGKYINDINENKESKSFANQMHVEIKAPELRRKLRSLYIVSSDLRIEPRVRKRGTNALPIALLCPKEYE